MSSSQRLALVLAAAVLLVGGFLVARGGGEKTASAPGGVTTGTVGTTTSATTTAPTPTTASPTIPVVVVSGGKPTGGVKDLTFAKGDTVAFSVRSDIADEIHVHGYDIMKDVKAGGSVTFSFRAKIDGIFEVELENAAVQIASLRVNP